MNDNSGDFYDDNINLFNEGDVVQDESSFDEGFGGTPQPEEPKRSPVVSGLIVIALIFITIIVILTVKGCSIQRVENNKNKENATNTNSSSVNNDKNKVENANNSNNTSKETNSQTTSEPMISTENSSNNTDNTDVSHNLQDYDASAVVENPQGNGVSSFVELSQLPAVGEEKTANVMVSSKVAYIMDDKTIAYCIKLIMPGDTNMDIIPYFCSKKTFDNVSFGETLNMVYNETEDGKISISAIQKL